ncbi:ankyrin repeat domain protein [Nitzschia inconspicua]|uniref:Ankyrin repeat domain protein n=1 Tax=Nitzschia inconspicua TaxID=303405 RepID=A0A9K3PK73_9STRA|nr:ankyrin repeat domain protein [Nitzschia inconspicua]
MTNSEAALDNSSIRKSVSFHDADNITKKNYQEEDDPTLNGGEETRSTRSIGSSASGLHHRKNGSMTTSLSMPESYRKQLYYGVAPQPKYLFFPWSRWYRWWFWLTTVWSIFTVFYETYAVGFLPLGLSPAGNPASIIEYCFLTLFTTDIAINFNLAYTDQEDVVVTDRRMIIWNYFRGWFWIDLIGVFPFYSIILAARDEIGIDDFQTRNLQLIRLLRVVRLHRVVHALQLTQYSSKISLLWYTMVRDFGGAIMWTHFAACMMFFIARQRDFQDSWLEAPADTETNFDLYVTSLYWSIVTFVTVGYGDFSPVNATEQIFGMVYMFLNMVITSWIIGTITLLVVKNDEKNGEYRTNLRLLDEYVTINNFDDGIRKRLKTQLKLDFNNREVSDENVLQHFPGTLRRKVIRQLYYPILSETHLMKNVRQVFVDSFLTSCSVELFGPGEDLIQRGTIPSDLYLLVDGSVKITSSTSVQTESVDKHGNSVVGGSVADSEYHVHGGPAIWRETNAGDFLNDIAFFTETPSSETIRTTSVCKTLTMPKSVYKAIVSDHMGSVQVVLQNLLAKAQKIAASQGRTTRVALSRRMEYLKAGSTFNVTGSRKDGEESEAEINDTIEGAQAEAALTNVEDLITMHIHKLKDDHTTRFLFAASREDLPTLRLMLNHGIDPDSADYDRRTALMVASMNGNADTVALLLEHHANPNMTDVHGTTALFEAVKGNHEDCMKILFKIWR